MKPLRLCCDCAWNRNGLCHAPLRDPVNGSTPYGSPIRNGHARQDYCGVAEARYYKPKRHRGKIVQEP